MTQKTFKLRRPSTPNLQPQPQEGFDSIDGRHPLQSKVPASIKLYRVRRRPNGKVLYFNFALAKEMGLVPVDHAPKLTRRLKRKILKTFSLIIINEYDLIKKKEFSRSSIKPHPYMATRYLQIQHQSRTGKTSGDGRSIWNGIWRGGGKTWDISSCGTGVTCLSPGMVEAKVPIRSGSNEFAYGNGMADQRECLEAALLSEIFHRRGVVTERILAVIGFKNGTAIHVRAAPNLIRPSHLFLHLKQGNLQELKNLLSYTLDREVENSQLFPNSIQAMLTQFLDNLARDFGRSSAHMESEYIFHWMDWDGDNLLLNGAILDYGSVRQFGLLHHQYRYDDIDRYSTTITEQRLKARHIVQTFHQAVDFVLTHNKKPLKTFQNQWATKKFDEHFENQMDKMFLRKLGLNPTQCEKVLNDIPPLVFSFQKIYRLFERTLTRRGTVVVGDGINHYAVYCMRDLMRELPRYLLQNDHLMPEKTFLKLLCSKFADRDSMKLTTRRKRLINEFQQLYIDILHSALAGKQTFRDLLLEATMRSSLVNRPDRLTGNGLISIIDRLLKILRKSGTKSFLRVFNAFVEQQAPSHSKSKVSSIPLSPSEKKALLSLQRIVSMYRHDI